MPEYDYRPSGEEHCPFCHQGFSYRQSIKEPRLTECPVCAAPVKRIITSFGTAVDASSATFEKRAKRAGFSFLRNEGSGQFRVDKGQQD